MYFYGKHKGEQLLFFCFIDHIFNEALHYRTFFSSVCLII